MKQSIVALVRPNLNLAQKESQAAHIIEHILVSPKRLKKLGITDDFYSHNIIFHGGVVNDTHLTEYYIVKTETANQVLKAIIKYQNDLFIDSDEFNIIKSTVITELLEDKGEFIDTGEQLAKAIYTLNSPAIRNPWNDIESIANLSYEKMLDIFENNNSNICALDLSFDKYSFDKISRIEKNNLREDCNSIKLEHPWQSPGCIDNYYLVRFSNPLDPILNMIYRWSLTENRFGLWFDEIRNKQGLVYYISLSTYYSQNAMEIYFSCKEADSKKVLSLIKKSLANYNSFIKKSLDFIKGRLKLDIELDWGNIQYQAQNEIDYVVSKVFNDSPVDLIEKINKITVNELTDFNNQFISSLNSNKTMFVERVHGKKLKTIID